VLDAPALQDDFYLNLVDWSANNVLAVGLGPCIYLWSASTSSVTKLQDLGPNDQITSVQWSNSGATLAVGTHSGDLQIWDVNKRKCLRTMKGHSGRVCAIAWNQNMLSTGSRDRGILHRDLRSNKDYEAQL
jgi:cell division cycle 20-like protein 1, cofactor of APC complex